MANVLIIDDDDSVRGYLTTLVNRLGHQPLSAATCAEGLEKIKDDTVEVIIADIFLPDSPPLDSWIGQIKEQAGRRPIILITGEPSEELAAKAREGDVMALLTKPFELAFIRKLLDDAAKVAAE